MNQKGQAALMDSIIFLTIVSAVVTMLFFFMVGYGDRVTGQLDSLYAEDFSIDTLKVITYINVLRDGRSIYEYDFKDVDQPSPEYDYLLAIMKEDHADDGTFSENTKQAIANTISSTLQPFEGSIDFAFFVLHEESDQFLFLMLATHEGEFNPDGSIDEDSIKRNYYECAPDDQELLTRQVFPHVGEINTAVGKVMLTEPISGKNTPFLMSLNLWVSKDIAILKDLRNPAEGVPDLNCGLILST